MIKNIKVNSVDDDTRIDRWLKRRFNSITQSFIEKKLRKGFIRVNNNKIKANYKVTANDIIKIYEYSKKNYPQISKTLNTKQIPKELLINFKKSVIFECSDFFIIDKWSGISTQGVSKFAISIDDIIKNISFNYNLVHRLDKDTSGILIIAKNLKSTKEFGKLFKNQMIEKKYFAICQGIPKNSNSIVKLKIDQKNKSKNILQTFTRYNVIKKYNKFCLIEFIPFTGKRHQLRIVSKYLNCPIIGDSRYNVNNNYLKEDLKLHAHFLKFIFNDKKYEFKSKLPKKFTSFMRKINLSMNINTL